MRPLLLAALILLSFVSLAQTGIEKHFKIFDTRLQRVTTIGQIAADCRDADILFFGEEHNDSAGHYLEAAIFRELFQAYGDKLALSMEMFETDCQLVLNEYLDGFISEDRFLRESRAWPNYRDYRPLVEFAKEDKLPVIAANPPRRYVNMVSRKGMKSLDGLPRASKKFLPPLPYDTLSGRYREKFMDIMRGSPGSGSSNIYYSQSLWDAGMSHSIYKYWKKNRDKKVFHLVGHFHSDEKLGTVAQLKKLNGKLRILNISCRADASFENPDWSKFSDLGDYIILTDPSLKKTY